jgi:transcriptional regulatory protein LevR
MIETYAERLQKKKERKKMSNYDMDEIVRQRDREKKSRGIVLEDEIEAAVTIELPDKDLLKLALAAHERNITLNKLCGIVIKDSLKSLDYKFEHETKPQLLKEY